MIKTTYQTPELRNANDEVVQEGAFGKNTALSNSTNDGWIDYVMNDLEALHDTIGDSAPTLDGNGHVVEPANLAIGDEDGVRLKTGYVQTSGGTVSGTLNVAQNLKMQDNQENVFGGMYVPASSATSQYLQVYGGEQPNGAGNARMSLYPNGDGRFFLTSYSTDGSTQYQLQGGNDGTLKWRGNTLAPLSSPAFTGNPTAPTQATNNDSTRLATTEYVKNNIKANLPQLTNVSATALASGDDLNDYGTPGTYYSGSVTITNTLVNCPVTGSGFKMFVFTTTGGSYSTQLIFTYNRKVYIRGFGGTAWNGWQMIALAEDVLSLTGGTMTGILRNENAISLLSKTLERGTIPSSNVTIPIFYFTDKEGAQISSIQTTVDTEGRIIMALNCRSFSGGTSTALRYVLYDVTSRDGYFAPSADNKINLGYNSFRWKQLYAATTTISTSDERLKDNIVAIPDEVLDAWGEVNWYQYQFKDSIEEKGETKARIHTGAIAQRIESVFESHGLDANKYGLLCYDEWQYEPAERDEDGNIVQEARPAGNRYSLRYEEALCMEAAYQRRRAYRLEQRLEAIEQRLSALETL